MLTSMVWRSFLFFSFPFFFLKKPVLGQSCETDATMMTFSNAVIQKIKDLKRNN